MNVQEVAAQYGEYLIEKRRYFHQHPEVSTKDNHTSKGNQRGAGRDRRFLAALWAGDGCAGHHFKAQSPARPFCFAEIWMLDGSGNHRGALCEQKRGHYACLRP